MKEQPKQIRITTLSKLLDTIQNTIELTLDDEKKKEGVRLALNAVRKELGLEAK